MLAIAGLPAALILLQPDLGTMLVLTATVFGVLATSGAPRRWLAGLERQLEGHDWITGDDFTIADITLADVLREVRETNLLDAYPNVKAFYARAFARPARQRARELTAERMGVGLDQIA